VNFYKLQNIFIYLSLSFLSSHIKRRGRWEKKKNKEKKQKLLWRHIKTSTTTPLLSLEISRWASPVTPKKVKNNKRRGPQESSNGVRTHLPLGYSCGLLWLPLVIFFDIIGFISLRYFQQYRWCYYRSFSIS
jgi:hypothetical protein